MCSYACVAKHLKAFIDKALIEVFLRPSYLHRHSRMAEGLLKDPVFPWKQELTYMGHKLRDSV